jgi:hypothetical protein
MNTQPRVMMSGARLFAIGGLALAVVGAIGTVAVRVVAPAPFLPTAFGFSAASMVAFVIMGLSWASIGAVLAIRRPENAVGRYMVAVGASYALSMFLTVLTFAFAADGTARGLRLAELAGWLTVLAQMFGVLVFAIGFIFPTGRAQSPRWAWFLRSYWLMAITFSVISLFQPGALFLVPTLQNPFGIGPDLRGDQPISPVIAAFGIITLLALAWSLVSRYRMAGRIERQQLKWFALALGLAAIGLAFVVCVTMLTDRPVDAIGLTVYGLAAAFVPVGIAIAILRYHLYDIDRLISRTLGYAVVTGLLAVVFTATILMLQNALTAFTQGRGIAVAFSTLLVFALFQPVRRRVQARIDRRFDRAHYDAELTVASFASRLRDDVDLVTVRAEILATTASAVRPTQASLWIRGAPR